MCLWEEWENQHRGENAGRPVVTSWGQEEKEDGAVSQRCMAICDMFYAHRKNVLCTPHQGIQKFGKALPVPPVPGGGGACVLLAGEEGEVPSAQPSPGQRASHRPPGSGAWEALLKASFPRVLGSEIVVLCCC